MSYDSFCLFVSNFCKLILTVLTAMLTYQDFYSIAKIKLWKFSSLAFFASFEFYSDFIIANSHELIRDRVDSILFKQIDHRA